MFYFHNYTHTFNSSIITCQPQAAHALGASTVTTAGSPSKRALLRSLGAQHVSNSRDTAYVEDLTAAHTEGAHVVLNTLTSPGMVSSAAALLRPGGRFVEIGKRDVTSVNRLVQERPDVGYSLLAIDFLPGAVLGALLGRISSRLASGAVCFEVALLLGKQTREVFWQ